MTDLQSRLDEIEKRRADRRAEVERATLEQRVLDLEAIDALEAEYGPNEIKTFEVPYLPGLPVVVAVRTGREPEVKRFLARLREKNANTHAAAEEAARSCLVYPTDRETVDRLVEKRRGLLVQVGTAAMNLASARAAEEGKE